LGWFRWIDIEKNQNFEEREIYRACLVDSKGSPIEIPIGFCDNNKDGIPQIS